MKQPVYPNKIDEKKKYVHFLDWYFTHIKKQDTLQNIMEYIKKHQLLGYHMTYKSLTTRSFAQTIQAHAPKGHYARHQTTVNKKSFIFWMLSKDFKGKKKRPNWGFEEKEYIKQHWHSMTDAEIANHLNRGVDGVIYQRLRCGCYRREPAGMGAK